MTDGLLLACFIYIPFTKQLVQTVHALHSALPNSPAPFARSPYEKINKTKTKEPKRGCGVYQDQIRSDQSGGGEIFHECAPRMIIRRGKSRAGNAQIPKLRKEWGKRGKGGGGKLLMESAGEGVFSGLGL